VFTVRYALSPYIKQIRFVFKGLIKITVRKDKASQWQKYQRMMAKQRKKDIYSYKGKTTE
jgi:hypothetical protein